MSQPRSATAAADASGRSSMMLCPAPGTVITRTPAAPRASRPAGALAAVLDATGLTGAESLHSAADVPMWRTGQPRMPGTGLVPSSAS